MLAKWWKKIALLILIIACIFNIISKLVNRISLNSELVSSAQYMYETYKDEQNQEQ